MAHESELRKQAAHLAARGASRSDKLVGQVKGSQRKSGINTLRLSVYLAGRVSGPTFERMRE